MFEFKTEEIISMKELVNAVKRQYIAYLMQKTNNNISKVAALTKTSRTQIYKHLYHSNTYNNINN